MQPPPIWLVVMAIGSGAFGAGFLCALALATPKQRAMFFSIAIFNVCVVVWNSLMLIVRTISL